MWSCNVPAIENEREKCESLLFLKGTLSVLLSHIIYDFTPMVFTVPMWGSEVANSKTEIHLTNTPIEVTWACDVTAIGGDGDFTSLVICYCVW